VFATVFSLIISVYALLCCLDFLKRFNQKNCNMSYSVSNFRNVLSAYQSLTVLTIQYNFMYKIWLMVPYILICGGTFTMVIIHNRDMGLIKTMMFTCFMTTNFFLQAVCYRIPGIVFTLSDEFIKKHLPNSLHVISKAGKNKVKHAEFL